MVDCFNVLLTKCKMPIHLLSPAGVMVKNIYMRGFRYIYLVSGSIKSPYGYADDEERLLVVHSIGQLGRTNHETGRVLLNCRVGISSLQ